MKLYLQILIIGILVFSSKQQFTCKISSESTENDGYYNAPTGTNGICTNTGVCQGEFSENPNSPASRPTLTGDCFHCKRANRFLDREQSVPWARCSWVCDNGYTDSQLGHPPSIPLQGYCQYCISQLKKIRGICGCDTEGEYLVDITSGICGTQCRPGYTQFKQGRQIRFQYTHCLYCYGGLVNNSNICECPTNTEYLTDVQSYKCGTKCKPNFTDNLDGSPSNLPSKGHCLTCLSTHTLYGKYCRLKCPTGQFFTSQSANCGTSCKPGYSDTYLRQYPQTPITANCIYCQDGMGISGARPYCHCFIANQYLTSTNDGKCGRTCISGYTDKPDGNPPNSPFITGPCLYCLAETHELFLGQCYSQCLNGFYHDYNGNCGTSCSFGYTDKQDGSTAQSPITGDCQYCIEGLVFKKNYVCECLESGEYFTSSNSKICGTTCDNGFTEQSNGGTPVQPLTGHCSYQRKCFHGQYFRQIDGNCGSGTCIPGYTDKIDGSFASDQIQSDCQYCLKGLISDGTCHCEAPNEYLMSISDGQCGETCLFGYTYFSNGVPPNDGTPSIGHCIYCLAGFRFENGKCFQ